MALSKSVKIICGVTISLMILSCLLFLWKRSGNPTRSSFEQSKLRNQDSVVLGYYNVVYQNVSTKAEKITPSKSKLLVQEFGSIQSV